MHRVAANERRALTFALSPGNTHDAPAGRPPWLDLGPPGAPRHLIMDRAYEGDETRPLALAFGDIPVVPPKSNRIEPWE